MIPCQSANSQGQSSISLHILLQEEWEILCEEAELENNDIKYLIAMSCDTNDLTQLILHRIDQLNDTKSDQLTSRLPPHGVTALHIATMKNQEAIVAKLLESVDPDIKDNYGWTPLHHAALVSQRLFDMLMTKKANSTLRSMLGATSQDIKRLTGRERALDKRSIFFQDSNKKTSELTVAELEQVSGLQQYSDECILDANLLESLWTSQPEKYDVRNFIFHPLFQEKLRATYQEMKQNPPLVTVIKEQLGDEAGLGLQARESLGFWKVIGEYTGKKLSVDQQKVPTSFEEAQHYAEETKYVLSDTDASEYGNISRFVTDGWPNISFLTLLNEKGLKTRQVLVVSSPDGIKESEEFLVDYGCQYFTLKWGQYSIKKKNEIRNFFRNPIKALLQEVNECYRKTRDLNMNAVLSYMTAEKRLYFPLMTPAVLIDLTCARIVPAKDWQILMKYKDIAIAKLKYLPHRVWLEKTLQILEIFDRNLSRLTSEGKDQISQKIRQFFLDAEGKLSVLQLIHGLICVNKSLQALFQKKLLIESIWAELEKELQNLSSYQYEEDEDFPFPVDWIKFIETS